jgi:nicotinamide-nucleotide amidase
VAGASSVLEGGVICYSNEVKHRELGISSELLGEFSAVSEPVAAQMAEAVRTKFGTHFGISVTGVAGPGSDDQGNPEGLVYVGLADENGTQVEKLNLGKGRDGIRIRAVQWALTTLWRELYDEANSPESIGLHPPL